jgi:hypothetical protein
MVHSNESALRNHDVIYTNIAMFIEMNSFNDKVLVNMNTAKMIKKSEHHIPYSS